MIIKSLVEFAEADRDGKAFLIGDLDFHGISDTTIGDLENAIRQGRLSTKAETIKAMYQYSRPRECSTPHTFWLPVSNFSHDQATLTGRVIRNGVIEESDNG